jgi:hypothetical protein
MKAQTPRGEVPHVAVNGAPLHSRPAVDSSYPPPSKRARGKPRKPSHPPLDEYESLWPTDKITAWPSDDWVVGAAVNPADWGDEDQWFLTGNGGGA